MELGFLVNVLVILLLMRLFGLWDFRSGGVWLLEVEDEVVVRVVFFGREGLIWCWEFFLMLERFIRRLELGMGERERE